MYEGERCTSFFLGLEKKKQEQMWINELTTKDGKNVNKIEEILKEVHVFYQDLYTKQKCNPVEANRALAALKRKISNEDKMWCDQKLTKEDITQAIKNLNKDKSPGNDGLTAEFYQCFRENITPILAEVVKYRRNKTNTENINTGDHNHLLQKPGRKGEFGKLQTDQLVKYGLQNNSKDTSKQTKRNHRYNNR